MEGKVDHKKDFISDGRAADCDSEDPGSNPIINRSNETMLQYIWGILRYIQTPRLTLGGLKFATQILSLLYFYLFYSGQDILSHYKST